MSFSVVLLGNPLFLPWKKNISTKTMTDQKVDDEIPNGNGTGNFFYDNPSFVVSQSDLHNRTDFRNLGGSSFTIIDDIDNPKTPSSLDDLKLIIPRIKKKFKSSCTKKNLYRRLPVLSWLPRYNTEFAVGDLVAGITVGLTLIPQGLAFSSIVGVPTQHGLYGSFLGCFIYIFFGSCKDVAYGPTAIQALLAFQAAGEYGLPYVILLCFLTGVVQILMGIFGLGFLVDFISEPVSSGFTSAGSLIIVVSLLKDILGIKASGKTFVGWCSSIVQNIHHTKPGDAIVGFSCIIFLFLMQYISSKRINPKNESSKKKHYDTINKFIWFIGISRNAILVFICAIVGYKYCTQTTLGISTNTSAYAIPPFAVIGNVPSGLPEFKVPPFGYAEEKNGTEIHHSFVDMVSKLSSGIIIVSIVGILEDIAVCKTFADGKPVDATQELLAIGISNLVNSFVQAFPGTGALARSAVNRASGARTTLGGLYSGILVMVSLILFTSYFYFIPKATLSAIIMSAAVVMVEIKILSPMWKTKKSDFVLWLITFAACLICPLEIGILIGILINLMLILYQSARPKITIEKLQAENGQEFLLLTPDRSLIFPSTDYVRKLVTKHSMRKPVPVIIDCSHIYGADYTAATVVLTLTQDFAARSQPLLFYNLRPSVSDVFHGLQPKELIIFYDGKHIDELLKDNVKTKEDHTMNVITE